MAKRLCVLFLSTLFFSMTGAVYSQTVSFGASGEGIFVPLQITKPDGGDAEYTTGTGRIHAPNINLDLHASANLGLTGFFLAMNVQNGKSNGMSFDQAYMWAKPLYWIELKLGRFKDYSLTGRFRDSKYYEFGDFIGTEGDIPDPFGIMTRFYGNSTSNNLVGAMISARPEFLLPGLFIGGMVKTAFSGGQPVDKAGDVYKGAQIGVGYKIPDIGHARLQYIGPEKITTVPSTRVDTPFIIEGAFDFTMIDDLFIEAGIKIPIKDKEDVITFQDAYSLALNVEYTYNRWDILGLFNMTFGRKETLGVIETKGDTGLAINLEPSYRTDWGRLGGDLRFEIIPGQKQENTIVGSYINTAGGYRYGAAVWAEYWLSSTSTVRGGLAIKAPTEVAGVKEPLKVTIPLILRFSL